MFPHTITIFNLVSGTYNRKVINEVFFHKKKIISQEGNGDKYTTAYNVILSNGALTTYLNYTDYISLKDKSKNFTLRENDIVVCGECEKINNLSDLQKSYKDYFLIRSISDNRYGDIELQNIEVTN